MVRCLRQQRPGRGCSPHARGDGPRIIRMDTFTARFSPRAWGWSGNLKSEIRDLKVLPTRVGMVRFCLAAAATSFCSPHARGDGPTMTLDSPRRTLFSPRAWGWSDRYAVVSTLPHVLPTRVGLVRQRACSAFVAPLFPTDISSSRCDKRGHRNEHASGPRTSKAEIRATCLSRRESLQAGNLRNEQVCAPSSAHRLSFRRRLRNNEGLFFNASSPWKGPLTRPAPAGENPGRGPSPQGLIFTHIFCWTPGVHGMHSSSPEGAT